MEVGKNDPSNNFLEKKQTQAAALPNASQQADAMPGNAPDPGKSGQATARPPTRMSKSHPGRSISDSRG